MWVEYSGKKCEFLQRKSVKIEQVNKANKRSNEIANHEKLAQTKLIAITEDYVIKYSHIHMNFKKIRVKV